MFNAFKQFTEPTKPKSLGQIGEEIAQEEYKKRGYKIIAKNEYNKKGLRLGEIDFIARNKNELIFVEVKTRNSDKGFFGNPIEAVNIYKQRKILKAVKVYLLKNRNLMGLRPQIDVCAVILPDIDKSAVSVKIYSNAVEDWS